MKDMFHRVTIKDWWWAIGPGDGWNSWNYGHTKRRNLGRKRIRRSARHRLKDELRKEIAWATI